MSIAFRREFGRFPVLVFSFARERFPRRELRVKKVNRGCLFFIFVRRRRGKKRAGENQEGSSLFLSLRDERSSQGYLFLSDSFFTREFGKTEVMSPGKLSNVKKRAYNSGSTPPSEKGPSKKFVGWLG